MSLSKSICSNVIIDNSNYATRHNDKLFCELKKGVIDFVFNVSIILNN